MTERSSPLPGDARSRSCFQRDNLWSALTARENVVVSLKLARSPTQSGARTPRSPPSASTGARTVRSPFCPEASSNASRSRQLPRGRLRSCLQTSRPASSTRANERIVLDALAKLRA